MLETQNICWPKEGHANTKWKLVRGAGRKLGSSQNRVNGDYEKTTGPIYLKFWQKFLLMSTTEIQKKKILAAKLTDLWPLIFQD